MASVKEILEAGLARLKNGDAWIKGQFVMCSNPVQRCHGADAEYAYCAVGAIRDDKGRPHEDALKALKEQLPTESAFGVETFNDRADTKFDDVKALYERAIAAQK